ncbi:MAG: hypothetical protein ACRCZ0_12565 [Cetobacterium sp.]
MNFKNIHKIKKSKNEMVFLPIKSNYIENVIKSISKNFFDNGVDSEGKKNLKILQEFMIYTQNGILNIVYKDNIKVFYEVKEKENRYKIMINNHNEKTIVESLDFYEVDYFLFEQINYDEHYFFMKVLKEFIIDEIMVNYKHKFIEEIEVLGIDERFKYCVYLIDCYATENGFGGSIFYADSIKEIIEVLKSVSERV